MNLFDKRLNPKNKSIVTFLAFSLVPMSSIATDIYIPSLPSMVVDLHTTVDCIRMSITVFLISYGFSQFFSGVIVDAWGRYHISILALLFFALLNVGIALSESITFLLIARTLQGICCGAIATAKRSILVDIHKGDKLKHYLSMMTIVWSIGPIIAPFLGGYLQKYFNWHANFIFMAGYCFIIAILELIYNGETIRNKNDLKVSSIVLSFKEMLQVPDFYYGLLILGVANGMVVLFGLSMPFIVEHKLGYTSVEMGLVSLIMGVSWMTGGFIGKIMIKKSMHKKLLLANIIQLGIISVMIFLGMKSYNLYTLVGFAFFIHVMAGFTFTTYFSYCLGRFPKMAGLSGGLTGGITYVLTSIFSYIIVWLIAPDNQETMAYGYLSLNLMILLFLFLNKRKNSNIKTLKQNEG